MYTFLAQIPEDTLIEKQKAVIERFAHKNVVYFISDGDSTKIGQAKNVFERLSQLQTGNPRRLIIIAVYASCKSNINEDEAMFHEWYKDKHIRGEWFYLTDSDFNGRPLGSIIKFPDCFCDYLGCDYYKADQQMKKNINDRIGNLYCRTPYYT